ncbi:MAG TPA: peptidyl-prolyl cis-trans isomerase [Saprospiraceae bacterium]|nr:peptidyl-prolyl cis-trans isomerase [Saprospiraceae bacterium]
MQKKGLIFILFLTLLSCEYLKQDTKQMPIARVKDNYLYIDDIKDIVSQATTKEDSALLVTNFINRWATKQLLLDQSQINLSVKQQKVFDKLVKDYKTELYTEAYKSNIVSKQLDSTITEQEYETFYNNNKENFRLNDHLLKIRYVYLDRNFSDIDAVKKQIKNFEKEDQQLLKEKSLTFKAYNFNDSTWIKKENIIEKIPVLKNQEKQLLKKSNFVQLQDSIGVYLVKIKDILTINDIAPLTYVKPTIKQIILNRRKLDLIKKLEKDITKDALKNKKFEIYPPQ